MDADRLSQAIALYEEQVNEAVKTNMQALYLDIGLLAWTIFMIFLSTIYANVAGILTTVGLGSATVLSQLQKWVDTTKAYLFKTGQLKQTVRRLRTELVMCRSTDEECLDKVKALLQGYMQALEDAASSSGSQTS